MGSARAVARRRFDAGRTQEAVDAALEEAISGGSLSPRSAKPTRLRRKLGVTSRVDAATVAQTLGVAVPTGPTASGWRHTSVRNRI